MKQPLNRQFLCFIVNLWKKLPPIFLGGQVVPSGNWFKASQLGQVTQATQVRVEWRKGGKGEP